MSIHRLVELQAAANRDRAAIVTDGGTVSYQDLNLRANAAARQLVAIGFRRGGHAIVRLPRGTDLAIVLLAILKCGGSYIWVDPARTSEYPMGVSLVSGRRGHEDRFLTVDAASLLAPAHPAPNLPVLTRGSDIACVLPDDSGAAAVMVPHDTITALCSAPPAGIGAWVGEQGAIDLWLGLMLGKTVTMGEPTVTPATRAA